MGTTKPEPAKVAVIVPAKDAAATIERCLAALTMSIRPPDQIVVVDDGSSDDTARRATEYGVELLNEPIARGPAAARNRGVRHVEAKIVVFVDADVVVHPNALSRLVGTLEADPSTDAVIGSYDDNPPARNLASLYANLRHHFIHVREADGAVVGTFWSGLGAIRRTTFLEFGGFDQRYCLPSIEDVELGMRLTAAGRCIRLKPFARATHLKRWTIRSLLRTDIFQRAIPWAGLIIRAGSIPQQLNTRPSERASAVVALIAPVALSASVIDTRFVLIAIAAGLLWAYLQREFLGFLLLKLGPGRTIAIAGLHWLYFIYAAGAFALVAARAKLLAKTDAVPLSPEVNHLTADKDKAGLRIRLPRGGTID